VQQFARKPIIIDLPFKLARETLGEALLELHKPEPVTIAKHIKGVSFIETFSFMVT